MYETKITIATGATADNITSATIKQAVHMKKKVSNQHSNLTVHHMRDA